jgi:hypothetical protein
MSSEKFWLLTLTRNFKEGGGEGENEKEKKKNN